ncbi:MAG TPA: FAD-dependent monooxygenase [Candidatus Binatia bacterium]|nr:FAD-dependent monooxygenase [Candidatus Binatia bacterium]
MTSEVDALVVGAGPVGMTLAWELHRHGMSCRVVEKNAARTDKSKALVLWSRTLEALHAMGGADAFVAAGMEAHGASLYAGGRRLVHLEFGGIESVYAYALMIPQSETERLLEERLATLGIAVERSAELVALERKGDGAVATVRRKGGSDERIRARWLLGCDGAHSAVRHLLDVPFAGDAEPNDWVLADVHVRGPIAPDEVSAYFHASGILVFFPISPGRFRVIADQGLAHGYDHPPDPTLAAMQALVDERGPSGVALADPIWLAGFRIHERKVAHYRPAERVFLAGDAAHIHSPAGGQGMNTGMQDAFNLAWKIGLVHRGRGRAQPLLDSYDVERGAVGEAVLRQAGIVTRMATLRSPIAQSIRNRLYAFLGSVSAVQSHAATLLSELAVHYRKSPLSGEHRGRGAHAWLLGAGAAPGDRMPDADLRDAATGRPVRILDLLRTPAHRLLALAGVDGGGTPGAAAHEVTASARAAARRYGDAIATSLVVPARCEPPRSAADGGEAVLVDDGGALHRALGAALPTLVLVRPDGYVGFRSQPADASALAAHLGTYLIPV